MPKLHVVPPPAYAYPHACIDQAPVCSAPSGETAEIIDPRRQRPVHKPRRPS